eukprot:scaffold3133_cov219-Chaetoceros_neogracile.AAC.2
MLNVQYCCHGHDFTFHGQARFSNNNVQDSMFNTDAVEDDADLVFGSKEHLLLEHFRTPTVEATVAVADVRRRGRWAPAQASNNALHPGIKDIFNFTKRTLRDGHASCSHHDSDLEDMPYKVQVQCGIFQLATRSLL